MGDRSTCRPEASLELKSIGARAILDPAYGGRLASLCIEGVEILVTERGHEMDWGCYVMAPWAGRIRGGRFEWGGSSIQLPQNLPPHALHGTVFGQPWVRQDEGTLACSLGSKWPWTGEVRSHVSLRPDRLIWRVEVHAESDAFPAVVGWHPWFRRQLSNGSLLALQFAPKAMLVRDPAGIPTGDRVRPTPGPWDDCFVDVERSPTLRWSDGLEVEVSSTCTHWVVYSEPEHAICVEPQSGPPDAFNLGQFEIARPGCPVVHTMTLRWNTARSSQ